MTTMVATTMTRSNRQRRRRAALLLALATLVVALSTTLTAAQHADVTAAPTITPQATFEDGNTAQEMVAEDPNFDPYHENGDEDNFAPLVPAAAMTHTPPEDAAAQDHEKQTYEPKNRQVEVFDFDPSEGLTFFVAAGERECFYQDAKFTGDEISGAYVVSSADSHIDLEVRVHELSFVGGGVAVCIGADMPGWNQSIGEEPRGCDNLPTIRRRGRSIRSPSIVRGGVPCLFSLHFDSETMLKLDFRSAAGSLVSTSSALSTPTRTGSSSRT